MPVTHDSPGSFIMPIICASFPLIFASKSALLSSPILLTSGPTSQGPYFDGDDLLLLEVALQTAAFDIDNRVLITDCAKLNGNKLKGGVFGAD